MNKPDVKKLILLNLPYVFAFYFADKIAAVFRLAPGAAFIDKLTNGFAVFGSAFANPLPSFHPVDLLIGLSAGVLLKLAVYVKGKNQYSLSDDPTLLGRPSGFELNVREVYVSAGAGFVVVLTGAVMTMPGLPKAPAAYNIDVDDSGRIVGLF